MGEGAEILENVTMPEPTSFTIFRGTKLLICLEMSFLQRISRIASQIMNWNLREITFLFQFHESQSTIARHPFTSLLILVCNKIRVLSGSPPSGFGSAMKLPFTNVRVNSFKM